jgi:hypothetical protein
MAATAIVIQTSQTLNIPLEVTTLEGFSFQANTTIRYEQNGHAPSLRDKFQKLADQWRRETRLLSASDEKILHPAYQSIIAMGWSAVPLVLQELQSRRGHWFWALRFMADVNPVPEGANIDQARSAWLAWGRQKGLLT